MEPPQASPDSDESKHGDKIRNDGDNQKDSPDDPTPIINQPEPVLAQTAGEPIGDAKGDDQPKTESWWKGFLYDVTVTDVVVAVFTIVMVIVAIYQNGLISDANISAADAATVAKDAVKLAENTAKQQLRAYVGVFKPRMDYDFDAKSGGVTVIVENSGQTPARNVAVRVRLIARELGPGDEHELKKIADEKPTSTSSFLATGESSKVLVYIPKEADKKRLESGADAISVCGEISYTDIFGEPHIRGFAYFIGGSVGLIPDGLLALAPIGNDGN